LAIAQTGWGFQPGVSVDLAHARPAKGIVHFTSPRRSIDPRRAAGASETPAWHPFRELLSNNVPTLITVFPGAFEGITRHYIVTGDIDAMWLAISRAQVWPYLPWQETRSLRELLEGVIRRQAAHDPPRP